MRGKEEVNKPGMKYVQVGSATDKAEAERRQGKEGMETGRLGNENEMK